MATKRCGACRKSYRGRGSRVYVQRETKLVRVTVCPGCARGAVAVLVSPPETDATLCRLCRTLPAVACEACTLEMRKKAAREALRSTGRAPDPDPRCTHCSGKMVQAPNGVWLCASPSCSARQRAVREKTDVQGGSA